MAAPDPHSDQILEVLAHAEELLEEGRSVDEACRILGIDRDTYWAWRRAHSRTFRATARRLEALESVHARLLQLLAEQQETIHRLETRLRRRSSGAPPVLGS